VMTRNDRETTDSGIWRSANDGFDWERVHQFPYTPGGTPPPAGQLVRAPGNDHMVYAAGGTALAVSSDGGVTFQNALPLPSGPFQGFNHVAAASAPAGTAVPPVVYCLGDNQLFLSLNGGTNWVQVQGTLPSGAGSSVGTANSRAPSVLVVSPKFPFEVYLVTNDHKLFRGGFSGILGTPQSNWEEIVQPTLGPQDSGNIFLAATQPGAGNLLFYSPQRSKAFVGQIEPASASDWMQLDQGNAVHVDLHGIFLSHDFQASLQNGSYQVKSGTVWLLSDGGLYRSTDGGKHFQAAQNINSLSCVNIACVAIQGAGPAISLNTGDNDGFYSMDGGAHWSPQDYGGGDNDCSYADPLRPHSMLIYTPRWDKHGHPSSGRLGQTVTVYETSPGHLPDARSGTSQAHTVLGPPLSADGSPIWNAGSFFGMRGSRPLVLNLPGDDASAPGDYVFIRFKKGSPSVVLRTRNILGITSRNDWDSNPALVTQQGPALPVADAGLVQASGGHSATAFYVGGDASNQLWKWTNGMTSWKQLVPGGGASAARRFFVNPYDPNLIYVLDNQDVKRSDDGGATWHTDTNFQIQLTSGGRIPVSRGQVSGEPEPVEVVLTDMLFDPLHPLVRFAIGEGGAFLTVDGVTWTRLLDTGGLPGRPVNCYYDWISDPANPALYVAFAGRSLVKISPIPIPLPPQKTVPFVVNEPTLLARQAVLAAGLVPKFTGAQTPTSFVSAQSPSAGNLVPAGSTVTMVLHKGPVP
jgi:PASTA domain